VTAAFSAPLGLSGPSLEQPLQLDQATIAEICKDPAKCQAYFDNNRSPFFCARGDGGV
jgi:hypothetical protein